MNTEPSFVQLVAQVLRGADRPLTLAEIQSRVEMIRPVNTSNPHATLRNAFTSVRQIATLGGRPAHYTWWPRHLAGSTFRQPLTSSDIQAGTLVADREVWMALWPDFYGGASRSRGEVTLMLADGPVIQARIEHLVDGQAVLGRCFPNVEDAALRGSLLRALFDVYAWDTRFGGIGISDEVPGIVLEQANAEEKHRVAEWVRNTLPEGDSWSDNYRRQVYGGFLLQLEADEMDDETFLRVCRETNRWQDLVNRLLALGRVDEATAIAHQVGDYELLQLADVFCQYDHADVAERLVGERAQSSNDSRLLEWLKRRAQERGDPAAALAFTEALFWRRPDLEGYQEVRELAQPLGQWDALRATVLNR